MEEFLTVKQFAKEAGVDAGRIRYWSKIKLLNPISRGENNGYKYYSYEQVTKAVTISRLLDLGKSHEEVSDIIKNHSPQNVSHQLKLYRSILREKMWKLDTLYATLEMRNDCLDLGLMADDEKDLRIYAADSVPLTLGAPISWNEYRNYFSAFVDFSSWARKQGVELTCPAGAYYESFEAFLNAPQFPNRFFFLNPFGEDRREGTYHLIGYEHGNFGELYSVGSRIKVFAKTHPDIPMGVVYVIYLIDEMCTSNPSEYLAQVCVVVPIQN